MNGKPKSKKSLFRSGTGPRNPGLLKEIPWQRTPPKPHAYAYSVGDRIGRDLTVIGHVAAGRWSELYQVWSFREWCPLTCKRLSDRWAENRKARAALRREQRILRRLHHPNIVRIFGGDDQEGSLFLLLEYLEGPTALDALESLPRRQMPVPDAVRTAIHAGAGLDHLHRSGFLHLDLKPANLLLRGGVPILMDLDTARRIQPPRSSREPLGTAPYMSPEQVNRLPLDVAADVYGLGATLYELLTGRWPFEDVYTGKEKRPGLEGRYPQIGETLPPSCRGLRSEVSISLDRSVMKSIAPDPKNRFHSVPEFLALLAEELNESVSLWPKRARLTGLEPGQGIEELEGRST